MTERILVVDNTVFKSRAAEIVELFAKAMEDTPPWRDMSLRVHREATAVTFDQESNLKNFRAVVAEEDGKIIGASTFRYFRLEDINEENDFTLLVEQLKVYLKGLQEKHGIKRLVNLSRTFVATANQGRGVATKLREKVIEDVTGEQNEGAIIITKHLSNNPAIIASSKHLGFQETGVRQQSYDGSYYEEYWYKVVPAELVQC